MKEIKYYNSYEDDFVESKNQQYDLKKNYKWIHENIIYKFFENIVYFFVIIIAFIYSKFFLRVTIKNRKLLRHSKGYYLYSNHTQMIGDVFNPFLITFPKKPKIICSSSNLGIPIIGKILPIAGALPIPNEIHMMMDFNDSISKLSKTRPIIIYPEAHLWPWYTMIRPFPKTSFNYPIKDDCDVYAATTTYKKSKLFRKPKIIIYIDGPFNKNDNLSKKENIINVHDKVYEAMVNRSRYSNYDYIEYKKKD